MSRTSVLKENQTVGSPHFTQRRQPRTRQTRTIEHLKRNARALEALSNSVLHILCARHLAKLEDPVADHVTQPVPPRVDVPAPIGVDR
eukprot:1883054-Rhodomonas_salina.1